MALSEEEVAAFEDYFYHITAAKGSGEHALRHILKPFAWAHSPLESQLQHLKVHPPTTNKGVEEDIQESSLSIMLDMSILLLSIHVQNSSRRKRSMVAFP